MKNGASIQVNDAAIEMRFVWRDFDGDDCFDQFRIEVKQHGTAKRFDFGACAVYGLRKLSKFFRDPSQTSVSGGFQNPDPRFYDVVRSGDAYLLSVRFEGTGLSETFEVRGGSVQLNDEFLRDY